MAFQFPANPVLGQQFAPVSGTTYEWNGTGWIFLGLNTASLYPAGIVLPYAGIAATIPFQGWLFCDGKSYAQADHPALFAVISTRYGGSATHFNVPDLRGLVVAGVDNMGGTARGVLTTATISNPLSVGGTGGSELVTLTAAQAPSHAHGITDVAHAHGVSDPTHAHAVYDPGHMHNSTMHDPTHNHGINDPGHAHNYHESNSTVGSAYASQGGGPSQIFNNTNAGTNTSVTSITTQVSATNTFVDIHAAGTGIGIYGTGTGIGIAASGTGLSTTNAAGGGGAHANVQPTLCLNYVIKT